MPAEAHPQDRAPWRPTKAEARALDAICQHGSCKAAAQALGVAHKTVEAQVLSSTKKGGFSTRLQCLLAWDRSASHRSRTQPFDAPAGLTMNEWRQQNPTPTHGCGHMQGRGAA